MNKCLRGIPCSEGLALGSTVIQKQVQRIERRFYVPTDRLVGEIERLEGAFRAVDQQIETLKKKMRILPNHDPFLILEAHQSLLNDPSFHKAAVARVRRQRINAEWALDQTVQEIRGVFDAIEDTYLRSRGEDVVSLQEQILMILNEPQRGATEDQSAVRDAVLVAHDLSPDLTIRAIRAGAVGLLLAGGSPNTHAAIIARAMGMPMISALPDLFEVVKPGMQVAMDGAEGVVELTPDADTVAQYEKRQLVASRERNELWQLAREPAVNADGEPYRIMANVDIVDELADGQAEVVDGIGLFRTEIPFLFADAPDEEELVESYRAVVSLVHPRSVVFRLFDLGGDKIPWFAGGRQEENPALGLRGIRFLLNNDSLFRMQVRAILRAVPLEGKVRILVPMVTQLSDLKRCRTVIEQERERLGLDGTQPVAVGAMIETPAAALMVPVLREVAEFFSIGSNDLVQYLLAVDRGNEAVADAYDPLHPSTLRLIRVVMEDAGKVPVALCGEMGADANMLPLLAGIGLRELSMPVRAVPRIKAVLRSLTSRDCRTLAERCLKATTGAEVRALLQVFHRRLGTDLLLGRRGEEE